MQSLQSLPFPKQKLETLKDPTDLYIKGEIGAFMYYHFIGQVVGSRSLPSAVPLVLKELAAYPKQQKALQYYHELVQSRHCPRCGDVVFYPDEIRLVNESWHRQCLELSLIH